MEMSEQISELVKALVAAQLELQDPRKLRTAKVRTKSGADYSYSYSGLQDVIPTIRKVLSGHGIAITQCASMGERGPLVTTQLTHVSGQYFRSALTMPSGPSPQDIGSAITYARRYSVEAMLGLAAEDDDGQRAQASVEAGPVASAPSSDIHTRAIQALSTRSSVDQILSWAERVASSIPERDDDWYRKAVVARLGQLGLDAIDQAEVVVEVGNRLGWNND